MAQLETETAKKDLLRSLFNPPQTPTERLGDISFKFINGWLSYPNFKEFVKAKWASYQISALGGYILKEKLKHLKGDLKI